MALTNTYVGGSVSLDNGTDTITGVPIGTASADRVVVQAFTPNGTGAPTAASIGGISANLLNMGNGLWSVSALVPTGTTATVVVTGQNGWTAIGTWTLTGNANPVPTASATDVSGAGAISVDVKDGGSVLGCGFDAASIATTPSWASGITNQSSAYVNSPGANSFSVRDGGQDFAAAQTVNTTLTGCAFPALGLVAFAPLPMGKVIEIKQAIRRASNW